jgi:DNA-binding SARP family transcriptional activator
VEFRILGPLEVLDGGRQIPLGGAKQRSLLALLLLARGRPVSSERLIDEMWDGRQPHTAHKIVQLHVSSLRKALGEDRISTIERGYVLHLEQGELDAERFENLTHAASGEPPAQALHELRAALELVRGEPLADLRLEESTVIHRSYASRLHGANAAYDLANESATRALHLCDVSQPDAAQPLPRGRDPSRGLLIPREAHRSGAEHAVPDQPQDVALPMPVR